MTIDKAQLIELLVQKTGLDKEHVEAQLQQLISRVHEAAEQGKSFHVQSFGTFRMMDEALHFEPDDTLQTEINHKYAGMKPIELIGAYKEVAPGEDVSAGEEVTESPVAAESEKQEPAAEEEYSHFVPLDEVEARTEEESIAKASFVLDESEVEKEQENRTHFQADSSAGRPKAAQRRKDPIGTVLVACVVVLAVGVAGWMVYDLGLFQASGLQVPVEAHTDENSQAATEQPVEAVAEPASGSTVPGPEINSGEPDSDPPQENTAPNEEGDELLEDGVRIYGLRGTATPEGNKGYTIVVHSFGDRGVAQEQRDKLSAQGYRVVISSVVVRGKRYWRVGLGQFESVGDAQEAARSLPKPFANDFFIKRIQ